MALLDDSAVCRCAANLGQDKHTLIAEYYGNIQLLSARAALYQVYIEVPVS